jgi:pilus assembly protein CpaB
MVKRKFTLVLALTMALGAAFLVYSYLQRIEAEYRAQKNLAKVVVPREQIPPRTRINAEMLTTKEIPKNLIHPQAVTSVSDLLNSISATVLYPGEQVLLPRVVGPGDVSHGLIYVLEPGKRAMGVAVDSVTGVSGFLSPGDRVDVAVKLLNPQDEQVAFLAVQNLRVLSVGSLLWRENPDEPAEELTTVNLEVTPEEALRVLMAVENGSIRLLLRPAVHETVPSPSQLRFKDFSS